MRPKPTHLAPEFVGQFADPSVVAVYHLRPPYPPQVIDQLLSLRVDAGPVLDAGTGTGDIARALAQHGVRVDALDPSAAMLARGRQLLGGDNPLLTWIQGTAETISRYSTNRFYQPYDLVQELEAGGLFHPVGQVETDPVPFTQTVADYVESFHSRNGLSRDRMEPAKAAEFDAACRGLIGPFAEIGLITLGVRGLVTWGIPAPIRST